MLDFDENFWILIIYWKFSEPKNGFVADDPL
ncbi:MAG: hypothetical protein ACJAS6_000929 [Rickettsiales bacterium]|jgi:hypothetical protein